MIGGIIQSRGRAAVVSEVSKCDGTVPTGHFQRLVDI